MPSDASATSEASDTSEVPRASEADEPVTGQAEAGRGAGGATAIGSLDTAADAGEGERPNQADRPDRLQ